jgi:hypothetical protein
VLLSVPFDRAAVQKIGDRKGWLTRLSGRGASGRQPFFHGIELWEENRPNARGRDTGDGRRLHEAGSAGEFDRDVRSAGGGIDQDRLRLHAISVFDHGLRLPRDRDLPRLHGHPAGLCLPWHLPGHLTLIPTGRTLP